MLVDCGSTHPAACALLKSLEPKFAEKGWKIIYDEDRYIGAARNLGAQHARGEYMMFMDDDNYAKPIEINVFVSVAQKTNADILTCPNQTFNSNKEPNEIRDGANIWVPLGGALSVGVFRNAFGDSNCFVKKSSFINVGGFSEDFGIGNDDWEFFARAVLKGMNLLTVPIPLYWYRFGTHCMTNTTKTVHNANLLRVIRPYVLTLGGDLGGLAHMALGLSAAGKQEVPFTALIKKTILCMRTQGLTVTIRKGRAYIRRWCVTRRS